MKTSYVYLESFGAVYRLTDRQFGRWRHKTVRQGFPPDLKDYGKLLCIITHQISNWDIEDAKNH